MATILDGKKARDFYKQKLTERVANLRARGIAPRLAIIQIGNNPESTIYIEQKKKFAAAIGAEVEHVQLSESVSDKEVAAEIGRFNGNPETHGIILQLPIPAGLDKLALIDHIDPHKDVDGLTGENQRLLDAASKGEGDTRFIPATARGVMMLLDFYGIDPQGKKAAVFGRSRLVGHPIADLLRMRGAKVSVIHSQTEHPEAMSRSADIVVAAIGKPRHIGTVFIKPGAVVVDVGINSVAGNKLEEEVPKRRLVGDVDFEAVQSVASAISPVPGGVGPMTVLALFDTLVVSAENRS